MVGIVQLRRCFAGRARSHLVIGGREELRPDDSSLLELPDSVSCVTDLDSLSAGTTSRLPPFIFPPHEVGWFDHMESGMTWRIRRVRLPTRGVG